MMKEEKQYLMTSKFSILSRTQKFFVRKRNVKM